MNFNSVEYKIRCKTDTSQDQLWEKFVGVCENENGFQVNKNGKIEEKVRATSYFDTNPLRFYRPNEDVSWVLRRRETNKNASITLKMRAREPQADTSFHTQNKGAYEYKYEKDVSGSSESYSQSAKVDVGKDYSLTKFDDDLVQLLRMKDDEGTAFHQLYNQLWDKNLYLCFQAKEFLWKRKKSLKYQGHSIELSITQWFHDENQSYRVLTELSFSYDTENAPENIEQSSNSLIEKFAQLPEAEEEPIRFQSKTQAAYNIGVNQGERRYFICRHCDYAQEDIGSPDPALSEDGIQRAERMQQYFASIPLHCAVHTNTRRTRETAERITQNNPGNPERVTHNTEETIGYVNGLPETVINVLIVGHSPTVPDLVERLGGNRPTSYPSFGDTYVVVSNGFTSLLRFSLN